MKSPHEMGKRKRNTPSAISVLLLPAGHEIRVGRAVQSRDTATEMEVVPWGQEERAGQLFEKRL